VHRDVRGRLRAYRFESLAADRLDVLVSTRLGGVSDGDYASLNLGLRTFDDPDKVLTNRERLFSTYGVPLDRSVWCLQVHGDAVTVIDAPDVAGGNRGAYSEDNIVLGTDSLVTGLTSVPLCITMADCAPVVLYDAAHHAVGLAHAGWRGTVARIASRTARTMHERYGTDPSTLTCAIGPSISAQNYEVGEEVITPAREVYGAAPVLRETGDGKALFDLWEANVVDLESAGVPRASIEVAGLSTSDRLDEFYSFRFETRGSRRETGRLATVVMLRP
jgi:polyphenol oxidase